MAIKKIKPSPESEAGMVVSESVVRMGVKEDNGVMIDERGVTIQGPISLPSSSSHIRIGGLWTMASPLQLTLPSTMATPGAVLTVNPPISSFTKIVKDVAVMAALTAGLSALG